MSATRTAVHAHRPWRFGPAVRRFALAPLVAVVGLGLVTALQFRIDASALEGSSHPDLEGGLFLPNEQLLVHLTAGLNGVVSDLLWIQCIQYMAKEFHQQDAKFAWLEHLSRTSARLDPLFTGVYQYGGTLMAGIGNDDGALDLLRQGMVARPDRYELPLEIAKVYVLNRREDPSAAAAASFYLAHAAQVKGGDENLTRWAYNLQMRHGLTDVGREIWREMAESGANQMLRDLGRRKLVEMNLHDLVEVLNTAAAAFEADRGCRPGTLQELSDAGYVRGLPQDPLGGTFFVDSEGVVRSTTLLDVVAQERLRFVRGAVTVFRDEQGRWPRSLEELADKGYLRSVPRHPNERERFYYDPNTGAVLDRPIMP